MQKYARFFETKLKVFLRKFVPTLEMFTSAEPETITAGEDPSSDNDSVIEMKPLSLEGKRKLYKCGEYYVTLAHIPTWPDYAQDNSYLFTKLDYLTGSPDAAGQTVNDELNSKVCLWQGDITCLEIDAIVNAANKSLLGGGGVDGCIHRAAGRELYNECKTLGGCRTGMAKITSGHNLPAKHVIHTVGPVGEKEVKLRSCYESCLRFVKEYDLRTLAFCCISTGIYGYPNEKAANVALSTVRDWLMENSTMVDRIIFCVFLQEDLDIYNKLMLKYFPCVVPSRCDNDDMQQSQGTMMDIKGLPGNTVGVSGQPGDNNVSGDASPVVESFVGERLVGETTDEMAVDKGAEITPGPIVTPVVESTGSERLVGETTDEMAVDKGAEITPGPIVTPVVESTGSKKLVGETTDEMAVDKGAEITPGPMVTPVVENTGSGRLVGETADEMAVDKGADITPGPMVTPVVERSGGEKLMGKTTDEMAGDKGAEITPDPMVTPVGDDVTMTTESQEKCPPAIQYVSTL